MPVPSAAPSLPARAAVAVALLAGFYVFGIGIAALLVWIPFGVHHYFGRSDIRLLWACFAGAGTILWSFRPRRDKFDSPGPRIQQTGQPQLFSVLSELATKTAQAMPSEVYIVPQVNAFVSQRGGAGGVGGRRVMGLGLPLMQLLTVSELKAIVAHEFGHFHGGDVSLGPIVYRTHRSIARTLEALSGSRLEWAFVAYGKLFLRVSTSVSRHQELRADELAASAVGPAPLISALRKIGGASVVFELFVATEVLPALDAGVVPPISSGFASFMSEPGIKDDIDSANLVIAGEAVNDPYDTHPPLADRVAALERLPGVMADRDDRPATSLLADASVFDRELADHLRPADEPRRAVTWDEFVEVARLPVWQRMLSARQRRLADVVFDELPSGVADTAALARRVKETIDTTTDDSELAERFAHVISMAIVVALHKSGWRFRYSPGQTVSMTREGAVVDPFEAATALAHGTTSREQWQEFCRRIGLPRTVA